MAGRWRDVDLSGAQRSVPPQRELVAAVDIESNADHDCQRFLKFGQEFAASARVAASGQTEEFRQSMKARLDSVAVRLVRLQMMSGSEAELVAGVADKEATQLKFAQAQDDQDAFAAAKDFAEKAAIALDEFKLSMTDDLVRGNALYLRHAKIMEEAFEGLDKRAGEKGAAGRVTADFVPTIDPVTKCALLNPVRNRLCGHYYGKASILGIIKQNRRARCPYVGCSNGAFLRESGLEFDAAMAVKIAERIRLGGGEEEVGLADSVQIDED